MQLRTNFQAMSKRWINILLSLSATILFFTACNKKMSSDNPLATNYYPSVIISSDNNVIYAVDPNTGKKNWEFSMPPLVPLAIYVLKPSPLIYNDMIYMASTASDTLYKINAKTGVLVKKITVTIPVPGSTPVAAPPFTVVATPIADGKLIYLATTNNSIYVIDTGTGLATWHFAGSAPLISSPTIYNGDVFFASTDGHVYCLNKTTGPDAGGMPVWDFPGSFVLADTLHPSFVSSPSICPPYLYIGSLTDSSVYCMYLTPPATYTALYPFSGDLRWTRKTGGAIASSPSTFAQRCIVGSNDFNVYCIDSQSNIIWSFHTNSQVNSSPIIDNQTVYIGSYDYFLYAINIIDGTQKWNFKANGLLKSSPLPYQGTIFIGGYDGKLYAVDSGFGTLKWSYPVIGNIECSPAIDDYTFKQYNSGISGFTN